MPRYDKLDSESRYNTYPFTTCPICGLTYTVMGENPHRNKKTKENIPDETLEDIDGNILTEEEYQEEMYADIDDIPIVEDFDMDFYEYDEKEEIENLFNVEEKCFNEKDIHAKYHARYTIAEKKYKSNLMKYSERCNFNNKILPILKNPEANEEVKKVLIENLCQVKFTESLEMTDFSTTHPKYEEFLKLLFATRWFIDELSPYVSNETIEYFRTKYHAGEIGKDGLRRGLTWWTHNKTR